MEFLYGLHTEYIEILIKIILCTLLAGLIGYNREKNGMMVGIRTHILVGLSAVMVQIMALKFARTLGDASDSMRISASFTQAVGFIGAGAIIKDQRDVKGIRGLTTAASIFFVACVSLAVGLGIYGPSIIITLFAYVFLSDTLGFKRKIIHRRHFEIVLSVDVTGNYRDSSKKIINSLNEIDAEVNSIQVTTMTSEKSKILLKLNINEGTDVNEILTSLIDIESVEKSEIISKNNK